MKKKVVVLMIVLTFILGNTTLVSALQQAEIDRNTSSIAYGIQVLNDRLIALNLEGEVGLSSNLALEGLYTHYEDAGKKENILDLNAKLSVLDNQDLDLSALVGYHADLEDSSNGHPRIGLLVSKRETEDLDLNAGLEFLLGTGSDENYIGYTLGFDYKLTRRTYLEIEHRRFAGQDRTEGLNVGMRYYF